MAKKEKNEIHILSLKEIRAENKRNRTVAKETQSLGKRFIEKERSIWQAKMDVNEEKLSLEEINEQYKNKFKYGIEPNKKGNAIDIKGLNKHFCNGINCEHILKDIDLEIKEGSVNVILGASGSGKSTLLNIMSGLTEPSEGDVIVNGKNMIYLTEAKRTKFREESISFVFQSYNLIPSLTVMENIKVGANLRDKDTEEIKMDDILDTLQLTTQAKKYPFQLSGGQNQRISIGRALAKNPKILFADEPTGALDEERGREALQLLLDINKKYKTTLVMVTHNPNFAAVADQVIYIKDGRVDKLKQNKTKSDATSVKWS